MKHYLIALVLMLSLHVGAVTVQPRHRHHPVAGQAAPAASDKSAATAQDADKASGEEIEAFSDTSSVAGQEDTTYTSQPSTDTDEDVADLVDDNVISKIFSGTVGVGGVVVAILVILAMLLFLLAPFIVVIMLLRYLLKRHNSRVALAEKAMETGQPIPDGMKEMASESPEYYKRKGIKNIAIGIGLLLMFSIWKAEMLSGIGLLIACWGVGQVIIAKTTK